MAFAPLPSEIEALEQITDMAEQDIANAPEGHLVASRAHGAPQYYRSIKGEKRTYLSRKNIDIAQQLAQKEYAQKALSIAKREMALIEKFLDLNRSATADRLDDVRNRPTEQKAKRMVLSKSAKPRLPQTANDIASTTSESPVRAYYLMAEGAQKLQRRPLPPLIALKALYEQLSPERKNLVNPYVTPDADYASQWESREPDPEHALTQPGTFTTEKGDLVRSKSEVIIADRLYRAGIPYHYEQPLRLGERGTILHPDFTVLDLQTRQEIIWEHFGLMDDASYVENALGKLNAYASCGLFPGDGLIVTFESGGQPLSLPTVSAIVSSLSTHAEPRDVAKRRLP